VFHAGTSSWTNLVNPSNLTSASKNHREVLGNFGGESQLVQKPNNGPVAFPQSQIFALRSRSSRSSSLPALEI
jgi:hypothetical protein